MRCVVFLSLLLSSILPAETPRREVIYGSAVTLGGQAVPLYSNGHLIYLHRPNRLQVFRPDTQLAYEQEVPCPFSASTCSVSAVAATRRGMAAIGIGYPGSAGYTSGIRIVDETGRETRFFPTGRYVPRQLVFDNQENLWSIGWQRDAQQNDRTDPEVYHVVRKYSVDGTLLGEFLPTSLWPAGQRPDLGGRGYWTMAAAADRIGALFNDNFSERVTEWVEWDRNGKLLRRTRFPEASRPEWRAFDGRGRLYGQFPNDGGLELRRLEGGDNAVWRPVPANLPDQTTGVLLGADGEQLVYRLNGGGNVRLVWARPGGEE